MFVRRKTLFGGERIVLNPTFSLLAVIVGLGLSYGERQGFWELPDYSSPSAAADTRAQSCADIPNGLEGGLGGLRCSLKAPPAQIALAPDPAQTLPETAPATQTQPAPSRLMADGGAKFLRP